MTSRGPNALSEVASDGTLHLCLRSCFAPPRNSMGPPKNDWILISLPNWVVQRRNKALIKTYDCRPSGLEGWVSPMAVAFQVCIIDVFSLPNLHIAVNLYDCLWPHMQKRKGTFLTRWVPIGPGCLSPKAPLVCVTTQIHRIEKSRRLRSMEGYAGLLMLRTNGMAKTLTYRAL